MKVELFAVYADGCFCIRIGNKYNILNANNPYYKCVFENGKYVLKEKIKKQ